MFDPPSVVWLLTIGHPTLPLPLQHLIIATQVNVTAIVAVTGRRKKIQGGKGEVGRVERCVAMDYLGFILGGREVVGRVGIGRG